MFWDLLARGRVTHHNFWSYSLWLPWTMYLHFSQGETWQDEVFCFLHITWKYYVHNTVHMLHVCHGFTLLKYVSCIHDINTYWGPVNKCQNNNIYTIFQKTFIDQCVRAPLHLCGAFTHVMSHVKAGFWCILTSQKLNLLQIFASMHRNALSWLA